ncbi:MAG TPA: flagellar basal body rod protein FlgB [Gaiellaceae bacterium]|jgi:flagellar basal-body rod protein FlgB|nr:flagellar basal body rod protein FlgB [Gaiellaceae bacterium]
MSLFDVTQLGLERAIQGSAMRQTALSSNIANANTPGYKPEDVDFHSALRAAFSDGGDSQSQALQNVSFAAQPDSNAVMQADGNGVDVDVQNAELAKNGLEYESLVTVARARLDILRYAMGVQ